MTRNVIIFFFVFPPNLMALEPHRDCPDDLDALWDGICVDDSEEYKKSLSSRTDGPRLGNASSFADGILQMSAVSNDSAPRAVILTTNGQILVGGRGNPGDDDFLIAKYYADGEVDTSFNTDGVATLNFSGATRDLVHGIGVQSDGKVIAVGKTENGVANDFNFALARFDVNGSLDTSFFTTGKRLHSVVVDENVARAVAIQTDGKYVVVGYSWYYGQYKSTITRYNTDGTSDNSFGMNGLTISDLSPSTNPNGLMAVTIQTDGAIFAAGISENTANMCLGVRYTAGGNLDTTYNTTGWAYPSFHAAQAHQCYAVALGTAGLLFIGGKSGTTSDLAVGRLRSDGTLDTSFKTNGKAINDVSANADAIFGLAVQTDGLVLATGFSHNGSNNDYVIARYASDGQLDTTFHTDGLNTAAILSAEDTGQAIAILDNGYISIAGRTYTGSKFNVGVARYQSDGTLGLAGALDNSFGTGGSLAIDFSGNDETYAVIQTTDGNLVVVGSDGTPDIAVMRLLLNGTLDTTFHTDGKYSANVGAVDELQAVIQQANGKIFVGGNTNTSQMALFRLETSGVLDTSFHTDGQAQFDTNVNNEELFDLVIQTDGLILAGGDENVAALARFYSDGSVDTSFHTDGFAANSSYGTQNRMPSHVIDTNGSIWGAGYNATSDRAIHRWLSNGNLDTSFDTDGIKVYDVWAGEYGKDMILLNGGEFAVISGDTGNNSQGAIERVKSDGTLDTSFDTDGSYYYQFSGANDSINEIMGPPGGKYVGAVDNTTDLMLARFRTNGRLDTAFSTDGVVSSNLGGSEITNGAFILKNGKICVVGNNTDMAIACYWP